jgi:3-mercaptopyruvate sulfurtransferase SseA
MNLEDFCNKITTSLPVKRESDDFRKDLEKTLENYLQSVKSLDDIIIDIRTWDETIKRIEAPLSCPVRGTIWVEKYAPKQSTSR